MTSCRSGISFFYIWCCMCTWVLFLSPGENEWVPCESGPIKLYLICLSELWFFIIYQTYALSFLLHLYISFLWLCLCVVEAHLLFDVEWYPIRSFFLSSVSLNHNKYSSPLLDTKICQELKLSALKLSLLSFHKGVFNRKRISNVTLLLNPSYSVCTMELHNLR